MPTPSQVLADTLLGRSVIDYILEKRSGRPQWSWQEIADQIADDTQGVVVLSRETLRLWINEATESVA